MKDNILGHWGDGNRFVIDVYPGGPLPPSSWDQYNTLWREWSHQKRDCWSGIENAPSKKYVCFVTVGQSDYLLQSDTIDWIEGFETLRIWTDKQQHWYFRVYLYGVFDENSACTWITNYGVEHQDQVNCYFLPRVIQRQIESYVACNWQMTQNVGPLLSFTKTCSTLSLAPSDVICEVHRRQCRMRNCMSDY